VYLIDEVHMLSNHSFQCLAEDAGRAAAAYQVSCWRPPTHKNCRSTVLSPLPAVSVSRRLAGPRLIGRTLEVHRRRRASAVRTRRAVALLGGAPCRGQPCAMALSLLDQFDRVRRRRAERGQYARRCSAPSTAAMVGPAHRCIGPLRDGPSLLAEVKETRSRRPRLTIAHWSSWRHFLQRIRDRANRARGPPLQDEEFDADSLNPPRAGDLAPKMCSSIIKSPLGGPARFGDGAGPSHGIRNDAAAAMLAFRPDAAAVSRRYRRSHGPPQAAIRLAPPQPPAAAAPPPSGSHAPPPGMGFAAGAPRGGGAPMPRRRMPPASG